LPLAEPVKVTKWHVHHDDITDFDREPNALGRKRKPHEQESSEPDDTTDEGETVEKKSRSESGDVEADGPELETEMTGEGYGCGWDPEAGEAGGEKGMEVPDAAHKLKRRKRGPKPSGTRRERPDVPQHPERRTRSAGPVGDWSKEPGRVWDNFLN